MIFEPINIVHSLNSIINKSITHLFDAEENISSKVKVVELSKILHVPDIEVFLFQPRNNLPMKTMSTTFFLYKKKKKLLSRIITLQSEFSCKYKTAKAYQSISSRRLNMLSLILLQQH